MYVTSLFAVLPKDVSMDAIREVETLPRKFKTEDAVPGLSVQVTENKPCEDVVEEAFGHIKLGFIWGRITLPYTHSLEKSRTQPQRHAFIWNKWISTKIQIVKDTSLF